MINTKSDKFNNTLLNISCFYSMTIYAISASLTSPILLEISNYINKDIKYMGTIFSFLFFGLISGAFLNNILSNYFNRKKITLFFYFLLPISIFFVTLSFNFLFIIIVFFFIGLAGGFIEVQVSVLIMDLNSKREGLFVNLVHVFFGIGAFIGPLISTLLISKGFSWKYPYYLLTILSIINLFFFIFLRVPVSKIGDNKYKFNFIQLRKLNKNILFFLLLAFAILFYTCSEMGLSSWLPTFLRIDRNFSNILAGRALSFLWLGIMVGRLITGFLTRKLRMFYILIFLTVLSIISITIGINLSNKLFIIILFALSGLFLSGIWPLIITIGGTRYPDKRNFILSQLTIFGGLGGLFSPWFIGKIYQNYSLFFGMSFNYLFLILVFIFSLTAFLFVRGKRL